MSSVICTNTIMLLDNVFLDLPWNLCRRDENGFCFLHAHALIDCVVHVEYQRTYVSISD